MSDRQSHVIGSSSVLLTENVIISFYSTLERFGSKPIIVINAVSPVWVDPDADKDRNVGQFNEIRQ